LQKGRNLAKLCLDRLHVFGTHAEKLLLRGRQFLEPRIGIRVTNPRHSHRDLTLHDRNLQQFVDRPLHLGIELTGAAEIPIRLVDSRLERFVQAGGTLRVERRDGLGVAIVAMVTGRIDGKRALYRTDLEWRNRTNRLQLAGRRLAVRDLARDHHEIRNQPVGGQP
jgi:hypothetical protein